MNCCNHNCNEGRACPLRQHEGGEIVLYEPDDVMGWTAILILALVVVFGGGLLLWAVAQLLPVFAPFIL